MLRRRAEQLDGTRRRIIEATVELHRTLGPASTRISEIARRAGVQRRTVYNHFPDDRALFAACSAHWRSLHPAPDPGRWMQIADRGERLRCALRDLYAWYGATEPMTANVLRDAEILPALRSVIEPGLGAYLRTIREVLAETIDVSGGGRRRAHVEATLTLAVDFHVWQMLAPLGDQDAADLVARFLDEAAAA